MGLFAKEDLDSDVVVLQMSPSSLINVTDVFHVCKNYAHVLLRDIFGYAHKSG